jgi:hypothetical protein
MKERPLLSRLLKRFHICRKQKPLKHFYQVRDMLFLKML